MVYPSEHRERRSQDFAAGCTYKHVVLLSGVCYRGRVRRRGYSTLPIFFLVSRSSDENSVCPSVRLSNA